MELRENETIDDLEINGLKIIQNKEWFKFGIDSVLLSGFAKDIKDGSKVLDIGTGTGIIAILLSAKTKAKEIVGIEIQNEVAEMAQRSIELNQLESRIKIINENILNIEKHFECGYFDAVVSNPPYQKNETGLKSENEKHLISRHEVTCSLEDIIDKGFKMLKDRGELYLVHRPERLVDVMCAMRKSKIEPKQVRLVQAKANEKPNLVLIKGVKNSKPFLKVEEPLIIYNDDGSYTDEVLEIYGKTKK